MFSRTSYLALAATGFVLIIVVVATLWWLQRPSPRRATQLDSLPSAQPAHQQPVPESATTIESNVQPAPSPGSENEGAKPVPNPPLSTSTDLDALEADLDNTIILEESYNDL